MSNTDDKWVSERNTLGDRRTLQKISDLRLKGMHESMNS